MYDKALMFVFKLSCVLVSGCVGILVSKCVCVCVC